jgi:aminopeptidase-like protein
MRTKYPEYHTSADNLDYVSPEGLQGGYEIYLKLIRNLESNCTLKAKNFCEPQFSKNASLRKPLINGVRLDDQSKLLSDVLATQMGFVILLIW